MGQPSEGALDDPAMPPELGTALDAASGDARGDGASPALGSAPAMVVTLVGVQLVRPVAWTASAAGAHARHRVQGWRQHHAVVAMSPAQRQAERRAARVDDEVALAARPTPVRRVGAGLFAPFLAGTDALSRAARLQSRAPASCSCSSNTRCSLAQTPAACQCRRRRQHVLPQQPRAAGTSFHCMPVRSTSRMPASAARSGVGGRPPFGLARSGGRSGAMAVHRSSGTTGFMPHQPATIGFVPASKHRPVGRGRCH